MELLEREFLPNGCVNEYHWDADRDTLVLSTSMNVDGILDFTNKQRLAGHNGFTKTRDMRHIGEIPLTEYYNLLNDNNMKPGDPDEAKLIMKWLRSSENSKFRTVDKI